MLYQEMTPSQIKKIIAENHPVLLPIGNLEFHSEHLPLGTDGEVVEGVLKRIEKRNPEKTALLPAFYYGTSSFAVAGPENGQGTVSVDSMVLAKFAENLFMNLLETGFRNIHGFVYHQGENFAQGMPMDLAFRLAGRRAIFAYLEKERGRGWWGDSSMSGYYDDNNVFNWIQLHCVSGGIHDKFGGDHAGVVETSAMMELKPETVHMELHTERDWYAASAKEASREFGKRYIDAMVEDNEKMLFGKN